MYVHIGDTVSVPIESIIIMVQENPIKVLFITMRA